MISTADILKASILIVDDKAANVALLEQLLRGAGYVSITSTMDPHAVCGLYRQNRYDLILLDLQMPEVDGFQVLEDLKKIAAGADLPVLVITAQPGHKLRALKAGAKDFISKPFDVGEVLMRVHNILEIRLLHRAQLILDGARLDTSQRLAGIGDWKYDFADHRLLWSEEIYRILGIARKDFPPDAEIFYRQVHPDDLAFVHQEKKAAAEGRRRVDFEHRIIRADGEVRYIHQITGMILDDQGQPAQESGTIQDITERKLADEALRQSEERYRLMFEHNPSPMWVFDPKTLEFLAVNDATLALYGHSRAEFLRLSARDIRPPEAVADFLHRAAALSPEFRAADRSQHRKKDGTVFPVDIFARGIDFAGRPARLVLAVDRTETERAAAAMIESEERYRKLLMLSPDAHFVQVDGLITLVNPAFCDLMGAAGPPQLLGRPALTVAHPDFHGLVQERQQKLRDQQHIPSSEMKFVRIDGTTIDVEVESVAFDFHGRKEIQVIARDITARQQAVTALRESEERFKFVARAVSDVVWDWDLSANTLWWNAGFLTTFGYLASEVEPSIEFWTSRIHPEDRGRVVAGLHQAIDTGEESWSAEYRFLRKDGSYAAVQDRGYIVRDAAGWGVRMVGGMRDLTEQKKLEAQFLRTQRMESIGTLAGGIAHDLNNVLAPILMSIELLKLDSNIDPGRNKILDTIYISCRRGADLVRQVLSFARGVDGQRVAIRLRHLVNDLEGIIGETFPRNIQIVSDVANDVWPITGDPTQIHQVLLNLAVNARDAMPQGGLLTIAASNVTLDEHFAAMSPEAKAGTHVLLQVTDTGSGIPPEVRDRIFEPFFTTKEIGKGTGIGLATVHTIIKSHGGFVVVDSEVGRGTTFKVFLPANPALRTTETQHPFILDLPRGRGELVLVVDDEASIREITKQTLEAFGYRVIVASDGAEAIALFAMQSDQIAIVVTDMMMPIMDGPATMQVLQRINPAIRFIAASGINSGDNIAKATSAGMKNFLLKPYTAETLLKMIREVLDQPADTPPTKPAGANHVAPVSQFGLEGRGGSKSGFPLPPMLENHSGAKKTPLASANGAEMKTKVRELT